MLTSDFKGTSLSMLGFGAMRLPLLENSAIDEAQVFRMTDEALERGVNYFDTAFPYHGGMSEIVMGKALARHPRGSFLLATKYPGHQIASSYDPKEVFERQLKKCGVEYFDFYLLHNVYEHSMPVYLDKKWGIIDYFKEQKRLGRIRHLGFSSHAHLDSMKEFLDLAGEDMEFCQIQLNWLDWTLQRARDKVALLNERKIPIWVMEPLRGGKLASLSEDAERRLKAARPDESVPAWSFRFLQNMPGVKMILSGMSAESQMKDNLKTFESARPLSEAEKQMLFEIAEEMKDTVPCTACRYCTDGCPMGLDIPMFLSTLNDLRFLPSTNSAMRIQGLPEESQPSACLGCGACAAVCPQKLNIPELIGELNAKLAKIPKWADISREREEAAKRMKSV